MEAPKSLFNKIYTSNPDSISIATSLSSSKTTEFHLVEGILHILQGNSSCFFIWDEKGQRFYAKNGTFVDHLSISSLHNVVNHFVYSATCLKIVDGFVKWVECFGSLFPTLRAFASATSSWLKRLRDIALKEEVKISELNTRTVPTLLGLANSLSSLCSGAEFLLQVVHEAVPTHWRDSSHSASAAEVTVHILDVLYKRLNEACLVQGGEEEAYRMLLYLFVGSLVPYIESLDSWLFEGILEDPYDELFFYENKSVSVNDTDFWEKSYLLRSLTRPKADIEVAGVASKHLACPLFIKDMAKEIVSAGKSLQLIRHVPISSYSVLSSGESYDDGDSPKSHNAPHNIHEMHRMHSIAGLTLVEVFFVSISGIIGHGDHVYNYFLQDGSSSSMSGKENPTSRSPRKLWLEFLDCVRRERDSSVSETSLVDGKEESGEFKTVNKLRYVKSFYPENPVITVCRKSLKANKNTWSMLNLSNTSHIPPLNDGVLWEAIFKDDNKQVSSSKQTNCAFGFQFSESQYVRSAYDKKLLETMFPFPTTLPSYQANLQLSELLPFQKNSSLSSKILEWIQITEPKGTMLPVICMQECLIVYIKKQVDFIGSHMLSKLLKDWRLMDELGVLRAIYLLGSGDLLQHFLTVIFDKLDRGESWDDEFELNMILQESITNSSDHMLLSTPDSLVVSVTKPHGSVDSEQDNVVTVPSTPRKNPENSLGINGLDVLNFTYKVPWPLELIANTEAIRKYNQVMHFLLKVKRAKYVLDKARRWIWKGKGKVTVSFKHHWLVEQKLLHFVDAFHQYVMDRVYHSAWQELCQGMANARSLDEVIEVHEAYLLSIQRQCFVVPDKLWALIASRINTILGLALDFYSIQQTLHSGGAVSAIKARCEMEVDRIEKQFDDCIAFLLRVLSFKLNVGHFPHLADLVTRINYNYYYISDTGNMIAAPGSESVKLGKTFPSRPG